jgi:hypothetical protein
MNKTWNMKTADGEERYLSADEAEERLCDVIMNIEETEKHWDALRGISPGLQLAAAVFHPEMSAKLWDTWPDWARRPAIKRDEDRELMVRTTVHEVMAFYEEEETMA